MTDNALPPTTSIINSLLSASDPVAAAQSAGWLTHENMEGLLAEARSSMGVDPGKARRIAQLVELLADTAGTAALVPHSQYLQAQTHAIDAEFDRALQLIDAAHDGFMQLGAGVQAARTRVGRMMVLQQTGRFAETLEAGRAVLAQVTTMRIPETEDEVQALEARVHHNMGVAFAQTGQYAEALAAYDDAAQRYQSLGMQLNLGDVSNDRGVSLMYLGRARDALHSFEAALATYDPGMTLKRAQTLGNIGGAQLLAGSFADGLRAYEQVRQLLAPLAAHSHKTTLLLDVADAYLSLNLFDTALADFQQAAQLAEESNMAGEHARALWGVGAALMALGRWDEARPYLERTEQIYLAAGNAPMRATVKLRQALMFEARRQPEAARNMARDALACVPDARWPQQQAQVLLTLARLALPDSRAAREYLDASATLVENLGLPQLRHSFNLLLGRSALQDGNLASAEKHLHVACEIADALRSGLNTDRLRVAFGTDKASAYETLVQLYLSRQANDDVSNAWDAAERARARAMVDLMNAATTPADQAAVDEAQQSVRALQNELNGVYNALLHGADPDMSAEKRAAHLAGLNARARTLEREIDTLQLRRSASAETGAALGAPATLSEMQQLLDARSACIAYFACGDVLHAFVIRHDRVDAVQVTGQLASLSGLLDQLTLQWDRFRAGLSFTARHATQLEASARKVLGQIYELVFARVAHLLEGCDALTVIPHGRLHQLPFQALHDAAGYLIDRFTISYAPSGTVLMLCARRKAPHVRRAVVIGVSDALIPNAVAEARAVGAQLAGTVLDGENATVENVSRAAGDATLLHFACHGLFRMGNPMFSSLKLHDGWLLAADVLNLRLNNAMVTLSACESGRSAAAVGDELMGLTRAFLGAGASTLMVSLWLVADDVAAKLMQRFYANIGIGLSVAASMRAAQLEFRRQFSHPFYWAPYVAIGSAA